MDILLLAPQPFFTERGTPIAVDLVLRALSERGDKVDLLTFHLGENVHYSGVSIHRTRNIPFIRSIRPGFSMRKAMIDILMAVKAFFMVIRGRYDVIHAVEESVFIALWLKRLFGIPYIYDMDSSLSQQMTEKYPTLFKPFAHLLRSLEAVAIHNAKAVVPVCDALRDEVVRYLPERVMVLRDVTLLPSTGSEPTDPQASNLRTELDLEGPIMMYVGNLESYQGIDLMLDSFALTLKRKEKASLVVIGGKEADIQRYQSYAQRLGIQKRVHFLGPRPIEHLASYLAQADILVSPRIKGNNTPMKIFSYLDSGKALLATNLPTHTQVLDEKVAMLADPSPRLFSDGVLSLLEDKKLRIKLGQAGKELISQRHTYPVFKQNLNTLYDWVDVKIDGEHAVQAQRAGGILRKLFH